MKDDLTRRDVVKIAGAAAAMAGPLIRTARADTNAVQFGIIGTGSRGTYLLKHLAKIDAGRCVAMCDIDNDQLDKAQKTIGGSPKRFKDYRELLAQKDVEAVIVTTPLFLHFPITKDALLSGKHVFCEKSLVFRPEEVHALRALKAEHPKQVLQTGLQRRYSKFYQTAKDMVDKGVLGKVTAMHCQWHRNMVNTPSALWTAKPGGEGNLKNWRLYRKYSGGLVAELTSHQVDVADWMFGTGPELVMGWGSIDLVNDGRDVYDNVQLIYRYPGKRQMTYSSVSCNQHSPLFGSSRPQMGEMIMGTDGTLHLTVGDDTNPAICWWYREPPKATTVEKTDKSKKENYVAGATMVAGGASRPVPLLFDDLALTGKESFLDKEVKFARRWLYSKGVMVQEEARNPVDTELESFFQNVRDGGTPRANIEVGLADSVAVILSNQAMDEGRKVYFNEIEKGSPAKGKAKNT